MLTCPCNVDPLSPHFKNVKLGLTGVYIFLIFVLNIYVLSKNKKKIFFHLEIIIFTIFKNDLLYRHVCVMPRKKLSHTSVPRCY